MLTLPNSPERSSRCPPTSLDYPLCHWVITPQRQYPFHQPNQRKQHFILPQLDGGRQPLAPTYHRPLALALASLTRTICIPTREFRPSSIKLENIPRLQGHSNYELWAKHMLAMFKSLDIKDIVVDNAQPNPTNLLAELQEYTTLCRHASLLVLQVVRPGILDTIVQFDSPHEMWDSQGGVITLITPNN